MDTGRKIRAFATKTLCLPKALKLGKKQNIIRLQAATSGRSNGRGETPATQAGVLRTKNIFIKNQK
jgi:hypothetical protein